MSDGAPTGCAIAAVRAVRAPRASSARSTARRASRPSHEPLPRSPSSGPPAVDESRAIGVDAEGCRSGSRDEEHSPGTGECTGVSGDHIGGDATAAPLAAASRGRQFLRRMRRQPGARGAHPDQVEAVTLQKREDRLECTLHPARCGEPGSSDACARDPLAVAGDHDAAPGLAEIDDAVVFALIDSPGDRWKTGGEKRLHAK